MKVVDLYNKQIAVLDQRLYNNLLVNTATLFTYYPVKLFFTKNAIFPRNLLDKSKFKVVRNIDMATHIIYNNFNTKSTVRLNSNDEISIDNNDPTYIELTKVDIETYNVLSVVENKVIMNTNVLFDYVYKEEEYDLEVLKQTLLYSPTDAILWNSNLIEYYKNNMHIFNMIWNKFTVKDKAILNKYKSL